MNEPEGRGTAWPEERGACDERRGKAVPLKRPAGERKTRYDWDVVLRGGRVIDPESGLDEVRDVAVRGSTVEEIGSGLPPGRAELDVAGLVVTAGFVDVHSHVNDIAGLRLQAMDGVTTALELEAGVTPVAAAYRNAAAEGRPVNYGFAASWALARMEAVAGSRWMAGWARSWPTSGARPGSARPRPRRSPPCWPGWRPTWPRERWASACSSGTPPVPARTSTCGWPAWPPRPARRPSRTRGT